MKTNHKISPWWVSVYIVLMFFTFTCERDVTVKSLSGNKLHYVDNFTRVTTVNSLVDVLFYDKKLVVKEIKK